MFGKKAATDAEIVNGIRVGGVERERYEYLLYRRHMDFVAKRPRKYRISDEEARDAYTEAFLSVVNQIIDRRFRGDSSIKTYLSRIFRNKCVDQHRKNSTVKVEWVETFPEIGDESRDFLRELMGKEDLENLKRQMVHVGERCREILMFSGLGFSPKEIAEKMGFKTPRSASSQRYKCLEKLKTLIAGENVRSS